MDVQLILIKEEAALATPIILNTPTTHADLRPWAETIAQATKIEHPSNILIIMDDEEWAEFCAAILEVSNVDLVSCETETLLWNGVAVRYVPDGMPIGESPEVAIEQRLEDIIDELEGLARKMHSLMIGVPREYIH